MNNVMHPGGGCNDNDPDLASIDLDTAARFHWVRTLCGVQVGPECLPPHIEAEACEAFRVLASWLELESFQARREVA